MRFIKLIFLLVLFQLHAQQGGMWIPSLLEGMNEEEMASLGSKLSASDIYDVNKSSLKDAIGHFNGGCTSEVISDKGLLLTNHHCGYSQIQSHSSLENDYIKNGFWAKSFEEEIPNEGLYVEFIVRIEDVTEVMLKDVSDDMGPGEKQSQIDKNRNAFKKTIEKEDWQGFKIRPFYKGNQYFLFITERFEDIRLVGAPPVSIGKFGSDTDNWVWPRHTGDFSLFRIYADKNNRPAKYSEDNRPYKPKHYLPISLDGIEEGDFTMVFGFPGRTNEYLPAVAVEQITQKVNPLKIAIREAALAVIDANMKEDDLVRIQYASKQARIANSWKKWIGENLGIEKSGAVNIKKNFEAAFTKALDDQGKADEYGNILPRFKELYSEFEDINLKRNSFVQVFYVTELMQMMLRATRMEMASEKGAEAFEKARASTIARIRSMHKNYSVKVDKGVYKNVMPLFTANVDASIYETTAFVDPEKALALLDGEMTEVLARLNNDPAYRYAKPMVLDFYKNVDPAFQRLNTEINALQTQYIKALMEVMPNERYFPDANGTLRVTYGKVNGYSPRDAVYYTPVTYLDGVIEKYVPGDYEFDVPEKLRRLYQEKDYGHYADKNGKLAVCFIGTNHTSGGNSGSPAIDAEGNLVGLNFDRVWEGTMSDMYYDPEICRNIMVDLRYVLFIIEKYAEADHLIREMKLVHPKR